MRRARRLLEAMFLAEALPLERYEVADRDTRRIVGHVEATWVGDAQDKAEAQFGANVIAFVENPGKPTPVGDELWGGRPWGRGKKESPSPTDPAAGPNYGMDEGAGRQK